VEGVSFQALERGQYSRVVDIQSLGVASSTQSTVAGSAIAPPAQWIEAVNSICDRRSRISAAAGRGARSPGAEAELFVRYPVGPRLP